MQLSGAQSTTQAEVKVSRSGEIVSISPQPLQDVPSPVAEVELSKSIETAIEQLLQPPSTAREVGVLKGIDLASPVTGRASHRSRSCRLQKN